MFFTESSAYIVPRCTMVLNLLLVLLSLVVVIVTCVQSALLAKVLDQRFTHECMLYGNCEENVLEDWRDLFTKVFAMRPQPDDGCQDFGECYTYRPEAQPTISRNLAFFIKACLRTNIHQLLLLRLPPLSLSSRQSHQHTILLLLCL